MPLQRCSNPQFLCTIAFRACDGLHAGSLVRFTVYDVREKLSQTAVPLGTAEITLGCIQDTARLRIPLRSTATAPGSSTGSGGGNAAAAAVAAAASGSSGFITLCTWTPDVPPDQRRMPARSPAKIMTSGDVAGELAGGQQQLMGQQQQSQLQQQQHQQQRGHRRSQSLPPKLGVKLFVPAHHRLSLYFANPNVSVWNVLKMWLLSSLLIFFRSRFTPIASILGSAATSASRS